MAPAMKERLLELLLPVSDLTAKDAAGWTILHHVAAFGTSEHYDQILKIAPELAEVRARNGMLPDEIRRFYKPRN